MIRLIAMTTPVVEDVPNAAALLAYCARVSSTANQGNHETGSNLLRFLIRRKEWSPLEMVSLTMEVETTRDVARQLLRHRSFSFQEFSQRYAEVESPFIFREARMQDLKDRQNSLENDDGTLEAWWRAAQIELGKLSKATYQAALSYGIAKEVARTVLPEGLTPSRLYMQGTLRSWLHWAWLRSDAKTQKEHRMLATEALEIIYSLFPDLAPVAENSA